MMPNADLPDPLWLFARLIRRGSGIRSQPVQCNFLSHEFITCTTRGPQSLRSLLNAAPNSSRECLTSMETAIMTFAEIDQLCLSTTNRPHRLLPIAASSFVSRAA